MRQFVDWVWGLRVCCGIEKRAPAKFCASLAQRTMDLMVEHRKKVLDGIHERLGPHGFDADVTFRDWLWAFQRIADLSANVEGDCTWSAPSHSRDLKSADFQLLNNALDRARKKFLETGDLDLGGKE